MNRNILLVAIGIFTQLAVLGATWNRAYFPNNPGANSEWKTIHLEIVPVDPRSLFQGNYVQLRYAISTVASDKFSGSDKDLQFGSPLYVSLERQGEVWVASKIAPQPPSTGLFVKGTSQSWGSSGGISVRYGIEQFYAPKEDAQKLESRTRRSWNGPSAKMLAKVVVNREGRAGLVELVPASE